MLTSAILFSLLGAVSMDTLKYVQVLFRHGDRTPVHTYPNDPYQVDSWPGGWGQLTTRGMRQAYEFGQYVRSRYVDSGFLPANYTSGDIYVLSSDMDRCISTADCMLAGLYPLVGDQIWNPVLPWRPVPVHTIPRGSDYLLKMYCPAYDKLFDEYMTSEYVTSLKGEYKDLIELIGQFSGYKPTFKSLVAMVDPVFVEVQHNRTLPEWLTMNDTYKRLIAFKDIKSSLKFPTLEMTRVRGGPILKHFLKKMEDVRDFNNVTQKIDFYSAHDTNINALLSAMKVYNKLHMMYAAAMFLELHHSDSEGWTVKILFRNDTTEPPYVMTVPGCDSSCPLADLRRLTKEAVPDDVIEECLGPRPPTVDCTSAADAQIGLYALLGNIVAAVVTVLVLSLEW